MKKVTLLLIALFLTSQVIMAQRYTSEIFTDVTVTQDVTYGSNATILFLAVAMEAIPQDLKMDIYTPDTDTETNRPLVLIFHTGNFLPPTFNGGCGGTKGDADVVELATRLAKMGYVAATVDYRLGWDPTNPEQSLRTFTIINAAYRGVQDSRTAVKFFKRSVAEDNNPYGIDPDKVAMWGFGTGAYVTYGSATLNTVEDTWIPKFFLGANPMIVPGINGDLNAETVGVVPAGFPGLPEGDTLCYINHPGYDSDFKLAVQMGGACGDTSWVTPNDVPMISVHVATDPFAPCTDGIVNVPPPINLPVVGVFGACTIIPLAYGEGVNDVFDVSYIDDVSNYVSSVNGGIEGFFPIYSDDPQESATWNFAYSSEPYGVEGSDCDTDQAGATVVMDSVMQYYIPRACLALDLPCDLGTYVNTNELEEALIGFEMTPNPAVDQVHFKSEKAPMQSIEIYDMQGKLVKSYQSIDAYDFDVHRNALNDGMYVARVNFEAGYISKQIVFTR